MIINKFEVGDKVQLVGDFLQEWSGGKTFTISNWSINNDGDCVYAIDCATAGDKIPWIREQWMKKAAA